MARADVRGWDINRLNENCHYARTADFVVSSVILTFMSRLLLPRRVSHTLPPPDAIVPYLREVGFGDTVPLKNFTFDNSLITSFVERWHPETPRSICCEVVPHRDVGVGRAAAQCQASGGSTAGDTEEGVVLVEACLAAGPCYLMMDKSNNLVHLRLPLLQDFGWCRALFWGSAVLAWTYQSLCSAAHQRGSRTSLTALRCCYPGYTRDFLSGVHQSEGFSCIPWLRVDRVKCQFNGEQPVPDASVNLDRISIQHTFDYRPTQEYYDWWRGACQVRHLSGQDILEDPKLAELPSDVQLTASQPRDILHLPRDHPDQRRHVREVKADTWPHTRRERGARERGLGEGVRKERVRSRWARLDIESDEEAEFDIHEDHGDIPSGADDSPPPPPTPPPRTA
ncbi:hypothetical protein Ahy_A07g033125 [Arachis hypogaea]|uniref:Aminotransferase-like plant mobile domain-containing protein n=1 Tax=Arachis hypogaea TaxID=3818 RepID=A0A445C8E2_ARAHY|nr:hypothetical protein Ahy_A07g033125 [Arachis hypogaea]